VVRTAVMASNFYLVLYRLEREAEESATIQRRVKNVWICISIPPYASMTWMEQFYFALLCINLYAVRLRSKYMILNGCISKRKCYIVTILAPFEPMHYLMVRDLSASPAYSASSLCRQLRYPQVNFRNHTGLAAG
jgi:hypothetical protein